MMDDLSTCCVVLCSTFLVFLSAVSVCADTHRNIIKSADYIHTHTEQRAEAKNNSVANTTGKTDTHNHSHVSMPIRYSIREQNTIASDYNVRYIYSRKCMLVLSIYNDTPISHRI